MKPNEAADRISRFAAEDICATGSNLEKAIAILKEKRNAVILAHYYQEEEIQDIADFVGDSLELARQAQKTKAEVILFAGVHFMAEGAKILNPNSRVLMPDLRAGCSLADSCPPEAFKKFKQAYPKAFVVSYINCSAAIKALSDVICTSSNAVKIVEHIPRDREVIFAPDRNLGAWVEQQTDRKLHLWQGACIVHETFSERKIAELRIRYPNAKLIAHPECLPSLLAEADFIGSTSKLIQYVEKSSDNEFIVATEEGILHQMKKRAPDKTLIPAPPNHNCSCNECPYMKLNTLEKVYLALRDLKPEVELPTGLRKAALLPLQRMLDWSA